MKGLLTLLSVATVALIGRAESVANEVVVSAADYGVSKNGRGLQTKNLQAALDAAGKLAQEQQKTAVVRLPAGRVESGSLFFNRDNVVLEIPRGSVIDLFCIHALRIRNLYLRNGGQAPLLRVRVSDLVEWTDADAQSLKGRIESDDIRKWNSIVLDRIVCP